MSKFVVCDLLNSKIKWSANLWRISWLQQYQLIHHRIVEMHGPKIFFVISLNHFYNWLLFIIDSLCMCTSCYCFIDVAFSLLHSFDLKRSSDSLKITNWLQTILLQYTQWYPCCFHADAGNSNNQAYLCIGEWKIFESSST